MEKFDITQSWYLSVLDDDHQFAGFVSRTRLLEKYREILGTQKGIYEREN